jgi:hypothetical protein
MQAEALAIGLPTALANIKDRVKRELKSAFPSPGRHICKQMIKTGLIEVLT